MRTVTQILAVIGAAVSLAGCATASAQTGDAGTLVVANQGDGTVSFVDVETFEILGTIEVGNGPHELTVSDDGSRVFVSMYGRQVGNDEIAVIDTISRKVTGRLSLAPSERPHGIAWRNGKIFATIEREGKVVMLDESGEIVWSGDTGGELGHMLAVSPDGSRIYTGNMKTHDISVISTAEGEGLIERIEVGKGPEGIALSPDGSEVWVAHRTGGGLSVIDTKTLEVVATPGEGIFSARLTFTPDGSKVIAYDMPTSNVVVFDSAARSEIGRYRPEKGVPVTGLAAPDSRSLWVIRYQPDAIFELDLETLTEGRTIETGSMPDGLAFVER